VHERSLSFVLLEAFTLALRRRFGARASLCLCFAHDKAPVVLRFHCTVFWPLA